MTKKDFKTLRIQAYEIWPHSRRNKRFSEIMSNYYVNIYSQKRKMRPSEQPAPKNFWPYSYQFYICNPILVFRCIINDSITNPFIDVMRYVEPGVDREGIDSVKMPLALVNSEELDNLLQNAKVDELLRVAKPEALEIVKNKRFSGLNLKERQDLFVCLNEELRKYLPLREDKIAFAKAKYNRIKSEQLKF